MDLVRGWISYSICSLQSSVQKKPIKVKKKKKYELRILKNYICIFYQIGIILFLETKEQKNISNFSYWFCLINFIIIVTKLY